VLDISDLESEVFDDENEDENEEVGIAEPAVVDFAYTQVVVNPEPEVIDSVNVAEHAPFRLPRLIVDLYAQVIDHMNAEPTVHLHTEPTYALFIGKQSPLPRLR
jgi:hypothetical protein